MRTMFNKTREPFRTGIPLWHSGHKGNGWGLSGFLKVTLPEAAEKWGDQEAGRSPVDWACVVWPPGSRLRDASKDQRIRVRRQKLAWRSSASLALGVISTSPCLSLLSDPTWKVSFGTAKGLYVSEATELKWREGWRKQVGLGLCAFIS